MIKSITDKFRRITTNQLYLPEIDGIRFLAILLVLLFHMHGYFVGKSTVPFTDKPDSYGALNAFLMRGDVGVELFFVLSGFILCLPFAQQYINNGKRVALKKYYLRRLTRLEPPYFIALTLIFILQLIGQVHPIGVLLPHSLASFIYSHNLIYHHAPILTVVAWSLEIEIQFYIFAPFLFRLLSLGKITRRVLLVTLIVAFIGLQQLYPPSFLSIYGFAQFFLMGILLADFYVSNVAAELFKKKWMAAIACLCMVSIVCLPVKDGSAALPVIFLARMALPFVLCLFFYTILKNSYVKKVFSYRFVPIIGGMCYSIYLLHYTVIAIFGKYTLRLRVTGYYLPNLFLQFILLGFLTLVISSIFYLYVERPFMSSKWLDMMMKKNRREQEINAVGGITKDN
jgi:peptidoglycan/LPS O-acetylase OafA/YrhL